MILAIVGSRSLAGNARAQTLIEGAFDRFQPEKLVTGDATGIDAMAIAEAVRRGIPFDSKPPKGGVKVWAAGPRGEYGYKPRNMEIVTECDLLVAIVGKNSSTYGGGWTADYARSVGKLAKRFDL